MFKPGDKVICVDNAFVEDELMKNVIYTIEQVTDEDSDMIRLENYTNSYFLWRFKDIKEDRKQKLEKISNVH
jgi:hypothetical protein